MTENLLEQLENILSPHPKAKFEATMPTVASNLLSNMLIIYSFKKQIELICGMFNDGLLLIKFNMKLYTSVTLSYLPKGITVQQIT